MTKLDVEHMLYNASCTDGQEYVNDMLDKGNTIQDIWDEANRVDWMCWVIMWTGHPPHIAEALYEWAKYWGVSTSHPQSNKDAADTLREIIPDITEIFTKESIDDYESKRRLLAQRCDGDG